VPNYSTHARTHLRALATLAALALVAPGASVVHAAHAAEATLLAADSTRPPAPAPDGERAAAASPLVTAPSSAAGRDGLAHVVDDELLGRSGKLRARLVTRARSMRIPALERLFGDSAFHAPGVHEVRDSAGLTLTLITLVPFDQKDQGRLGSYRMGFWPGERRAPRSSAYENPEGFIEVTRENQDTYVSEHFRLRDFLTKDQGDVWPKYLVLREELVDKLELIIDDLQSRGVKVRRMAVLSGFRTPQYNQKGVGRRGGRAQDSRHQFGDAADVFVDNDGNGRMDDLNRDGRVDTRDAQIVIDAATRVEKRHPELAGGAGRYRATRAHGPFAHIDVRGTAARWRNG
jgi:hypothetical protein